MAQQLRAAGDEVRLLAVIGARVNQATLELAWRRDIWRKLRRFPSLPLKEAAAKVHGISREVVRRVRVHYGLIRPTSELMTESELEAEAGTPEVRALHAELARNYKPEPYPGSVTIDR